MSDCGAKSENLPVENFAIDTKHNFLRIGAREGTVNTATARRGQLCLRTADGTHGIDWRKPLWLVGCAHVSLTHTRTPITIGAHSATTIA